jgi:MerR HTH family regulatory protein
MPPLTLSTKALSNRSGLAVRQIQTFTDAGVLIPDEGTEAPGRGATRQYPRSEEEVAKLIGAIFHRGMPVAEARGIATTLRKIIRAPDDLGFKGVEEARKLRSYLASGLAISYIPGEFIPEPHQFMHHCAVFQKSKPRWGHVEVTEHNLRTTRAWIILELAKRGEIDPIIFLYRGADETWLYEFWAILPITDDGQHDYSFGNTSIAVKRVQASATSDEKAAYDVEFDHILIELSREQCGSPTKRRGGYVIMPRSVYRGSISTV